MKSSSSRPVSPEFYSVRRTAWILGVEPDTVAHAIRVGTLRAVRRRGQLVIPSSSVVRLLSEPVDNGQQSGGTA